MKRNRAEEAQLTAFIQADGMPLSQGCELPSAGEYSKNGCQHDAFHGSNGLFVRVRPRRGQPATKKGKPRCSIAAVGDFAPKCLHKLSAKTSDQARKSAGSVGRAVRGRCPLPCFAEQMPAVQLLGISRSSLSLKGKRGHPLKEARTVGELRKADFGLMGCCEAP